MKFYVTVVLLFMALTFVCIYLAVAYCELCHGLLNIYGLISRLLFLKIKGHLIHDVIMSSFALLWRKRQQTVHLLF